MIPIRVILTENELAEDFIASFRAKRLSEKFFYWFPLSVRAWLALCADGDYRNYVRSRSLIARSSTELATLMAGGPLQVLSLGSGQGDKDLILLEALRGAGALVTYVPLDTSQALLEMAAGGALEAGIPAEGIKADFTRSDHLAAVSAAPQTPPRLVVMFGNTLGSLDPLAAAKELAALLRPGDLLLVDGEIFGGEQTMAGYDNPVNRAFAWAPLHAVGIRDEDGELRFEMGEDDRLPGLHLIPKHFAPARAIRVQMGGEPLELAEGDRLQMNHSYKYSAEALVAILEGVGLEILWRGLSDDERFLMVMAAQR